MNELKSIGVLGAGQMGSGIAQVAAMSGFHVEVQDISQDSLGKCRKRIEQSLAKLQEKGKISASENSAALERINYVTALENLGQCGLVIEAVTEQPSLKYDLLKRLDSFCGPDTILATNTSSISITEIASQTKRPEKVIGMHFMNPVPLMKLVEIISGLRTSPETVSYVKKLSTHMGKTTVESKDYPGFIVNRILMPMINEAVYTLYEGLASAADIDAAMTLGTNQPMGPLTLADFIGLDTCLAIMEVLHKGLGDTKYRPCPLLRQYVAAGLLGRKSGRGFFSYQDQR